MDMSFTEAEKILHNPRKGSESLGSVAWAEFPRNQGITLMGRSPLPPLSFASNISINMVGLRYS